MKNLLKNNRGFTLIEVIAAIGITGIVALLAVTQLKSSNKAVTTSVVSSETNYLKNLVIAQMSIPLACENTFATKPLVNAAIDLKDKNDAVFLRVGQVIEDFKLVGASQAKNLFTVTAIRTAATPGTNNGLTITVEYDLNTNMQRLSNKKSNSFKVDVFITKANPASTTVKSCFFDASKMVARAVRDSCTGNAARYSPAENVCYHEVSFNSVKVVTNSAVCPAGQFLKEVSNVGTPSNSVGAPATAPTPANALVNFRCETFSTQGPPCGTDEAMRGTDANGNAICVKFATLFSGSARALNVVAGGYQTVDLNCPANQVLVRINPKLCIDKIIPKTCTAPGQYVKSVDGNGNFTCGYYDKGTSGSCPTGTYLTTINPDGTAPAGSCQPLTLSADCGGGALTAVDTYGNATWCQ